MALYTNQNAASAIASVEFSPVSEGNFSFFYVRDAARKDEVKTWLKGAGQAVETEAVMNGQPVLVTHGDKSQKELEEALAARGDTLELYQRKIPFSEKAWKTGATLALVGQFMQLASSFLRPNRKIDYGLFMLAVPNL